MFKKRGKKKDYKGFFSRNKFWIAVATLIGAIVGAGVLGIPYVIAKAGFLYGSILIVILGIVFLLLNLYVAEIVLRTKGKHQLTGYMEKYLGKKGKILMMISMIFGVYGALIAYLIGEGETIKAIFGGNALIYSLIFFVIVSIIIYRGVKATGRTELIIIALLFIVVILIGLFSLDKITLSNFSTFNPAYFFLPYGVILFAFLGNIAVPEVAEELEREKKKMKKAIIIGSLIPIVLYILFSVVVVGVVGLGNFELLGPNERIATIALSMYSNPILGILANVFAIFAMLTSFLALGIALVTMYNYDFKISKNTSFILTLAVPLVIVLFKLTNFLEVLGIAGAVSAGINCVLITIAFHKAKKKGDRKPEFTLNAPWIVSLVIVLVILIGVIGELVGFF